MIGKTNAGGGGGSGATLTITAPAGCTVTVAKDGKTKTRTANAAGIAEFKGLATGSWVVTIAKDGQTAAKTVTINADYSVAIEFSTIPVFTYTGDFKITDDSGNEISTTQGNWRIRFLTSGTLVFSSLGSANKGIDVFCVGGGAGGQRNQDSGYSPCRPGGGGGYTKTTKNVAVKKGESYQIVIGAGGAGGSNGGNGVGSKTTDPYGNGIPTNCRGYGQGTTTKAFGEADGELFAGGGGGSWNNEPSQPGGAGGGGAAWKAGTANTGGGGGCCASGGSGIVIIRNARG